MCLEKIDQKLTKRYKARKKPIVVWKLIEHTNFSIYKDYMWEPGINVSSRKSTKLLKSELKKGKVYSGFHCFLTKFQLSSMLSYYHELNVTVLAYKVIKVLIDPKDVVAVGTGTEGTLDIVATKATWVETRNLYGLNYNE